MKFTTVIKTSFFILFPRVLISTALSSWQQLGSPGNVQLQSYLLEGVSIPQSARSLLSDQPSSAVEPRGAFGIPHTAEILEKHEYIFATTICNNEMEPGVTVLQESLLATGHRAPLLVIASVSVARAVFERLALLPLVAMFRATSGDAGYCGERLKDVCGVNCSHLKLLLFGLLPVKKIVFLEHDTVVLRDLSGLAGHPGFSGVREGGTGQFGTTIMVLRPDGQVEEVLRREFCGRVFRGDCTSDHDVIRDAVPYAVWTDVNDRFCVPQIHLETIWYRKGDRQVAVIHFPGKVKPWNWWLDGTGSGMAVEGIRIWCRMADRTRFGCGEREGSGMEMEPFPSPLGWSRGRRLTVLLSTFRRESWDELVKHYASLWVVGLLVLVWQDPVGDLPVLSGVGGKVVMWQAKRDSLNNRFFAEGNVTECVYVCDDDMKISEEMLIRGMRVWNGHTRRLVGFFPRRWSLEKPYYLARVIDGYNVVLTKGLFTHRYFLYLYVHLLPRRVKRIVDQYGNCEDLLFNIMVSGFTGLAPLHVLVKGQIFDFGQQSGISGRENHFNERFLCVREFISELGLRKAPLSVGSYSARPLKNLEGNEASV